jgi:hypothetical protein
MGGGLASRCVGRVYGAHGAKNTPIKLPSCIKLAFHSISLLTFCWAIVYPKI